MSETSSRSAQRSLARETHPYGANNYDPLPVVSEAEGCWVRDAGDQEYLDMLSDYSPVDAGNVTS